MEPVKWFIVNESAYFITIIPEQLQNLKTDNIWNNKLAAPRNKLAHPDKTISTPMYTKSQNNRNIARLFTLSTSKYYCDQKAKIHTDMGFKDVPCSAQLVVIVVVIMVFFNIFYIVEISTFIWFCGSVKKATGFQLTFETF